VDDVGHGLKGEAEYETWVENAGGHDERFPCCVVVVIQCLACGAREVGEGSATYDIT